MENSEYLYEFEKDTPIREVSLKEVLWKYLAKWPWFIAGIALSFAVSFLYLYYTTPLFEANATILIKDDSKGGGGLNEISAFEDLGIINRKSNLENEIEILRSRSLMIRVVQELKLNITCFIDKHPLDIEQYTDAPYIIGFSKGDSSILNTSAFFSIRQLSSSAFETTGYDDKKVTSHQFGKPFDIGFGEMIVIPAVTGGAINKEKILVEINPVNKIASRYTQRLKVEPVNSKSNVIHLSLKDPVKGKAVDILNSLIRQYREDAIEDKNQVSINTAQFINERIRFITNELALVEGSAQQYKTSNTLVDIPSEAEIFLSTGSENEKELIQANIQVQLSRYVFNYLNEVKNIFDLIPANLGLTDVSIMNMIDQHNKLVLDRNRIQRNSNDKNPVVTNLEAQISSLRQSVKAGLSNIIGTLELKEAALRKQENVINSRISSVPRHEREYREIQRQQQIKESLYLYLLQKREETAIALAVTVSNAKVIDSAYSKGNVVSPNKQVFYSVAMLLGLLLPIGLIYFTGLFDTRIHDKEDVKKSGLPFLGEIPVSKTQDKLVVQASDKTGISEAFRSLRTNVSFMIDHNLKKAPVVFITSTIAKEGKTFLAINLAAITAASGKRVLLVGMDLRTPRILEYLNMPPSKGVTNHLIDASSRLEDFILPVPKVENMYVLPSGDIPPNPAELLMTDRIKEIFSQVRNAFDYIVVDTAPAGLVTDTVLIANQADAFIYVLRARFSDKRTLAIPESLYKDRKLPNMALLINETSHAGSYGYAYGYGYGLEEKKVWWRRSLKKMK
jgi:tyrosine-protein kinase Etk/Wzc